MHIQYIDYLYAIVCSSVLEWPLLFFKPLLKYQFQREFDTLLLPDHLQYAQYYYTGNNYCNTDYFRISISTCFRDQHLVALCTCTDCFEAAPLQHFIADFSATANMPYTPPPLTIEGHYALYLYSLLHCREPSELPHYLHLLRFTFRRDFPAEPFPEHLVDSVYLYDNGRTRLQRWEIIERGISRCPCGICLRLRQVRLLYNAIVLAADLTSLAAPASSG